AISRASYDLATKEDVLQRYGRVGDLGEVAQELAQQNLQKRKLKPGDLSVTQVFNRLKEIAEISGEGTVEKKLDILTSVLLRSLDPLSAKYLVRILLSKLRLGIGDPTILDAIITAKVGEKTQRKVLEAAYNRTS